MSKKSVAVLSMVGIVVLLGFGGCTGAVDATPIVLNNDATPTPDPADELIDLLVLRSPYYR